MGETLSLGPNELVTVPSVHELHRPIPPNPGHDVGVSEQTASAAEAPEAIDETTDTETLDPVDRRTIDRQWWRGDRKVLIVVGIAALGFVLMIRGVLSGVTGDDRISLPDAVEDVTPVPGAVQVLNQTSVFVDLAPGFTGEFVIDGEPIETINVDEVGAVTVEPGQQVDLPPVTIYEPGNATLTFSPSSGAAIEEFTEGEHRVVLRYWLIEDGPARARSFTWTFNVF